MTEDERREIARIVGMGALKYFILKVDARKNMLFNPEESIDFNGNTGPFIQYTHARIRSILRKSEELKLKSEEFATALNEKEIELIQKMNEFPVVVEQAGKDLSDDAFNFRGRLLLFCSRVAVDEAPYTGPFYCHACLLQRAAGFAPL
jgi:arginyl-tRNA synthetase